MRLAKVLGNVVCTIKNPELHGYKLLVVQPIDAHFKNQGKPMVAIDSIGAGAGETVIWCRGKEASFPFEPNNVPTDCTITGIVDTVTTK
ncbi:MAG: EutN/CcmL family microcompartment protein [Blastocatellia bacterium]|nr:EutN/CcmL family microcompartment protein [Blastocatellia bacterium]